MVESETMAQLSRMSIQMGGAFALIGIALLYLYIAISDAANTTKVLWASGLSLGVAVIFMSIWVLARDAAKQREAHRK